jgi:ribosome-binding factor A
MVSKNRARKIADRIAEELAILFQREVRDPRLEGVTVTGVDLDRELAYASVFVSLLDAEDRIPEVLEALEGAQGYLRSMLAARIQLRTFPQLRFRHDPSPARGARVEELLEALEHDENESAEGDET